MAGTKKINKAKTRAAVVVTSYEILENMDGNPNTLAEHDASVAYKDDLYFKADEGATEVEMNKVKILNFIHKELHHVTERKVPVLDVDNDHPNIEVYHRAEYDGISMDVCVFWPAQGKEDFKQCIAMVKLTSDNLSAANTCAIIDGDASWTTEAKTDKFTVKNDKLNKNYWAPRWKYVVNILRNLAFKGYEKNGVKKPELEVIAGENSDAEAGDEGSEETEVLMTIFSGSSGKIIGPKGAKIQEIKRLSGVKDIKMPAKDEDATRPRARDPAEITIIGKPQAIAKAKKLVQEVVDEWVSAPRPPRDGGYQASQIDYSADNAGADTLGGSGEEAVGMVGEWGASGSTDAGAGSGEWSGDTGSGAW